MKYRFLVAVLVLSACNATTPKKENNIIVADGTEIQQFEAMFFCSDKEGFMVALGDVGTHLGKSWDAIMGDNNQTECTVRIKVNKAGDILEHEIVTCEDPTKLIDVIKVASPVPVPTNECLLQKVNEVNYTLNSNKEKS
ncbi:hypothetical protein L1F30_15665 [Simiduia sp. 21SJ11W-1]|uniref:hypothetical protein n=1 Tax=Simiduia sp. 21SJ11W-1 TaxID=2909669 RepID=UPI00209E419D|nr:hypothetical protein [Simiduia sp. 21SJ11W-1]UTA47579.1 hypothetical protein L1F30_15665 [Simiduia sp. 21SJ11W-1]